MSVQFQAEADGKVLVVRVREKLSTSDYERFVPEFENLIEQHGKIRILLQMDEFHGWKAGALWDDLKLDFKHFSDIERIAMVGDKAWEKGMSVFCKPFTTATIRYFDHRDVEQAHRWVTEGLPSQRTAPTAGGR